MIEKKYPRLRTVDKVKPPYLLNSFPNSFGLKLARELVYLLSTKGKPVLEGPEWEEIFANCIGAKWKPSNVGLDDITLDSCAWGAKTVKSSKPSTQNIVRLISGRNSPTYSFGDSKTITADPNHVGKNVLSIWNERVSAIRKLYKHVRTVVLLKSTSLHEVAVFEFDTIRYDPDLFIWSWNARSNLEGYNKSNNFHRFTWQPHGSQFTILEETPADCLIIRIKTPPKPLNKSKYLESIGFDKSWVSISKKKDG